MIIPAWPIPAVEEWRQGVWMAASRGMRLGARLRGGARGVKDAVQGVEVLQDKDPGPAQHRVQHVRDVKQRAQRVHVFGRQHAACAVPGLWSHRGAAPLQSSRALPAQVCSEHKSGHHHIAATLAA